MSKRKVYTIKSRMVITTLLVTIFLVIPKLYQAVAQDQLSDTKIVIVQGRAPLSLGKDAWGKALEDALHNAVMDGGGTRINGEKLVEKQVESIKQSIKECKKYVNRWEIIHETRDKENIILKMQVEVGSDLENAIRHDLLDKKMEEATLEQLYDWIGKPKVLVDIEETIEQVESKTNITQIEIERMFKEKGVDIYEKKQLEKIKNRGKRLHYDDPEQMRVLNNDYDIQLIIEGTCLSKFRGEVKIYPELPPVKDYTTYISLNSYRTATAWKFTPQQYDDTDPRDVLLGGSGILEAATKSINYVLRKHMDDILQGIITDWRNALLKPRSIEVTISGLTNDEMDRLINYLLKTESKYIKGIPKSRIRFARGVVNFEIEFQGPQSELERILKTYKAPISLDLVQTEEDRINLRAVAGQIRTMQPGTYEISLKGVTLGQLQNFEDFLKEQGLVIDRRSYEKSNGLLEVKYSNPISTMAEDIIPSFPDPKLVVVGLSSLRMEVWAEESWQRHLQGR